MKEITELKRIIASLRESGERVTSFNDACRMEIAIHDLEQAVEMLEAVKNEENAKKLK